MKTTLIERRNAWRSLSHQDKQSRLMDLRHRNEKLVQLEMSRLQHAR